ncbi:MAG: succinate dehydrogenase, hydrophobic membrane anchor protein [Alphaproteobacteria bacterium]|nr:succinate dehydrogenase, hydrophobic membrane anchor protein [Alphaproteobacteria bacterium]
MSGRTALGRVRGLGAAKDGTHHWWVQRLTSIALVPLTLWFVVSVVRLVGADHGAVAGWIASPVPAVLLVLFIAVTFHHMQLGLQVVIEDYVHNEAAKIGTIILVKFAAALLGLGAVFAVLKIAFGG